MSLKVYLSGSTQHDNVGVGQYGTEEYRMQSLADKVAWYIGKGKGDIVCYRNNGNMNLNQTISDSNSKSPDIHVALHTNAGGGKGTECYYSNYPILSTQGKKLAQLIYDAVAPLTISSDRGCKADTTLFSTGLAETRETTAKACLIEIMFHDNLTDVNDYLQKDELIAINIAKAIYNYFGLAYYTEPTPIPDPDPIPDPTPEKTEKEKVIEFIDYHNAWELIMRMFNL